MQNLWKVLTALPLMFACCFYGGSLGPSYEYVPPPASFNENDLVGTWQAKYGFTNTDTITLKADGTYRQVFQAPEINFYYESPWNEWHIEYSSSGKPKLHLGKMRYYASAIEIGDSEGEFPKGIPILFYDADEDELIEMTDKVILAINGDEGSSRGITLRHMQFDADDSPEYFILIEND